MRRGISLFAGAASNQSGCTKGNPEAVHVSGILIPSGTPLVVHLDTSSWNVSNFFKISLKQVMIDFIG